MMVGWAVATLGQVGLKLVDLACVVVGIRWIMMLGIVHMIC